MERQNGKKNQDPLELKPMRPEGSAYIVIEGISKTCCNNYFEVLSFCHLNQKWSNKL